MIERRLMAFRRHHLLLLTWLFSAIFVGKARALVFSNPSDAHGVTNGTWASFSCTVSCTHTLSWAVGYQPFPNRLLLSSGSDAVEQFSETTGLLVRRQTLTHCPTTAVTDASYSEQLEILATPESNRTAVQCIAFRSTVQRRDHYSKYAVLSVKPVELAPEEPTVTVTDSIEPSQPQPQLTPSPSPTVCATETRDVTTTTTHTVNRITTVTSIMYVTATPVLEALPTPGLVTEEPATSQRHSPIGSPEPTEDTANLATTSSQLRPKGLSLLSLAFLLLITLTATSH